MKPFVGLFLLVCPILAQRLPSVLQETHGSCSPAVVTDGGDVTIECYGLTEDQQSILNRMLFLVERSNRNQDQILTKLDEMLAALERSAEDISAVRHEVGGRRLTQGQVDKIVSRVSKYSGQLVQIWAAARDSEVISFARQIETTFKKAGLKASLMQGMVFSRRSGIDITLTVAEKTEPAFALANALASAGIKIVVRVRPETPSDVVRIVVWPKD